MLFAIISTDSCTWNKHVTSIVFTDVNMGMTTILYLLYIVLILFLLLCFIMPCTSQSYLVLVNISHLAGITNQSCN